MSCPPKILYHLNQIGLQFPFALVTSHTRKPRIQIHRWYYGRAIIGYWSKMVWNKLCPTFINRLGGKSCTFIQTINKAKGKFLVKGRAKTKLMILQPIISYFLFFIFLFFYFLIGTSYLLRPKKKKKFYLRGRLISLFF